jgi:hypothetical protein
MVVADVTPTKRSESSTVKLFPAYTSYSVAFEEGCHEMVTREPRVVVAVALWGDWHFSMTDYRADKVSNAGGRKPCSAPVAVGDAFCGGRIDEAAVDGGGDLFGVAELVVEAAEYFDRDIGTTIEGPADPDMVGEMPTGAQIVRRMLQQRGAHKRPGGTAAESITGDDPVVVGRAEEHSVVHKGAGLDGLCEQSGCGEVVGLTPMDIVVSGPGRADPVQGDFV